MLTPPLAPARQIKKKKKSVVRQLTYCRFNCLQCRCNECEGTHVWVEKCDACKSGQSERGILTPTKECNKCVQKQCTVCIVERMCRWCTTCDKVCKK